MATVYPMPQWGVTMEDGVITEWRIKVADWVNEGDIIATIGTDKIDVDFESPGKGIVARLLADEGDTVRCGADLLVLADDEADYENYLQSVT